METDAQVEGIQRFRIHGEPYAVVYFSHRDDLETIRQAQLSEDQFPKNLRPGERVRVLYVAGVVAGVRRHEASPERGGKQTV
jgi:hypothetical protein